MLIWFVSLSPCSAPWVRSISMTLEPTLPRFCRSSMLRNGPFFRASAIGIAALSTLGKVPNIIKTIEELSELQQALCKYLTGPVDEAVYANVHEELADAGIMLNRMLMIFDATEVFDWRDSKLDAMATRLGVTIMGVGGERHED